MPEALDAWVWLARIRRPQGRKGEVFADILTDFPERFTSRRRLWLLPAETPARAGRLAAPGKAMAAREVELKHFWLHKGGVVLHFAGVDSISAAEELKGLIAAIPKEERATLGEGEIYISDLIGCEVVDVAGGAVAVGEIVEVDRASSPVPLLVVRGAQGEVLIPFAKSYLHRIDVKAKRVEMALPEGLIDLNAAEEA